MLYTFIIVTVLTTHIAQNASCAQISQILVCEGHRHIQGWSLESYIIIQLRENVKEFFVHGPHPDFPSMFVEYIRKVIKIARWIHPIRITNWIWPK